MNAPDTRLPVTLLTGFLGAGKSTLLNFVLRHPAMHGTAVVINEYGEVGIDHHLVESAPESTELIADGCMCCTARGQVVEALMSLFTRAQQHKFVLKRVIIETTGLAEPAPILSQLLHVPRLAERFYMDSVVTLVDALNGAPTLDSEDIAVQQVTAADRLLVSKTDLVKAKAASALRRRLARMNPDAVVEIVNNGVVQPEQLFSGGRHTPGSSSFETGSWLAGADHFRLSPVSPANNLLLFGEGTKPPGEQDIQTFSVVVDEPLSPGTYFGWLAFLRSLCGPTLLRLKGLVHLREQPGPVVVHGVQQVFHPTVQLAQWPSEDRRTRLVFITRGWGKEVVASTLSYLNTGLQPAGALGTSCSR